MASFKGMHAVGLIEGQIPPSKNKKGLKNWGGT